MEIKTQRGRIAKDLLYVENTLSNVGQYSLSASPWRIATERDLVKTSSMNDKLVQDEFLFMKKHSSSNFHFLAWITFDYTKY